MTSEKTRILNQKADPCRRDRCGINLLLLGSSEETQNKGKGAVAYNAILDGASRTRARGRNNQ